ncbi:MAG: Gfo/Idh/MocA family oxidoreductase [Chloroflexi bacterium]|nr:Gfo/Idh/MocA family oxidoreductase [Chloroflexota bacterium]MCY3936950.1 Gfo/Idh/MocA family oxidoreductase [Chloroflexota bacterium]
MIRLGVIGCGRILPAHLRGLREIKTRGLADFEITALCSRNIDDAKMFRSPDDGVPPRPPTANDQTDPLSAPHVYVSELQSGRPEVYSDYRHMLDSDSVDAVIVLTALDSHHTIGVDCLESGRHVMMEKPLAITVKAARMLVDAAAKHDLTLATAEVIRYLEPIRAVHWTIRHGRIGRLQSVLAGGMGSPDWSPDYIAAHTAWRHVKQRAGGGPSIDFGVHLFDMIEYQCGEIDSVGAVTATTEPVRRYRGDAPFEGTVENELEDVAMITYRFKSGAIGSLTLSWGAHGDVVAVPGGKAIYGSKGSIVGTELTDDLGDKSDTIELMRAEASPDQLERWFPGGLEDPFGLELLDWLQAIEDSQREPEVDGAGGLRDLAVAYSVVESSVAGRQVKVDEVASGSVDEYQREIDVALGI